MPRDAVSRTANVGAVGTNGLIMGGNEMSFINKVCPEIGLNISCKMHRFPFWISNGFLNFVKTNLISDSVHNFDLYYLSLTDNFYANNQKTLFQTQ